MELRDYLKALKPELRERLAAAAETTVPYLYQLAGGHRMASARLAIRIEDASQGEVTREELRPDIWA